MCRKDIIFAQNFENCAMNDIPSFNSYIVKTIKENWLLDALTDYKGATLQYHDVARKIEKLHIMMAAAGIEKETVLLYADVTLLIGLLLILPH